MAKMELGMLNKPDLIYGLNLVSPIKSVIKYKSTMSPRDQIIYKPNKQILLRQLLKGLV